MRGLDSSGRDGLVAKVSIREASPGDAPTVVRLLRRMLNEMASVGGHPVTRAEEAWARLDRAVATRIQENDHLFLLAEKTGASRLLIGLAQASVLTREVVFEPSRVLHIHALYVAEAHRRRGVGRALLRATLEWGRASECAEAELNVLLANPAQDLYEGLGFSASQMEMVREL